MLREVTLIKYQQELGSVRFQSLDGMWNSGGEKPHIADAAVCHKALAIPISGSDTRIAIQHDCPFRRSVPMQLSYASCGESHENTSQIFRNWKFPNRYFVRPSAVIKALVGH